MHGVVRLEHYALQYGAERRRLRIFKMRGRNFRGGFHDFVIRKGGVALFPRLIAAEHADGMEAAEPLLSCIAELDALLGGGLDRGTSTLLMGPSGSGKSSLAMQFVMSALDRGERALFVTFDETKAILSKRAAGMGWHLEQPIASGQLTLEQVDPAELSPGELTGMIRRHVEADNVRIVVLDSLSGYQNAIPAEQFMLLLMHEMLTYLNHRGRNDSNPCPARTGRLHAVQCRPDISERQRSAVTIFRGCREDPARHFSVEEAHWTARGRNQGVSTRQ